MPAHLSRAARRSGLCAARFTASAITSITATTTAATATIISAIIAAVAAFTATASPLPSPRCLHDAAVASAAFIAAIAVIIADHHLE